MDVGSFLINGVSGGELGARIQNRPVLAIPQRKTNDNDDVPLRSGALLFDDSGYRNTLMDLSMYVVGDSFKHSSYNRNRLVDLFQQGTYNEFIPYFDSDKIYYTRLTGGSFNGRREYGHIQPLSLSLSVKPFKRLRHVKPITAVKNGTLLNPTLFNSYPKITIEGNGNINLYVNGKEIVLLSVEGHIVLDSEALVAYRIINNQPHSQNDKMYSLDFPEFESGINHIDWSGNVTKVTIEPRWQVLT